MKPQYLVLLMCLLAGCRVDMPAPDRGVFVDDTNKLSLALASKTPSPIKPGVPAFKAATDRLDPPASPGDFRQAWHNKPVVQGLTGQCWAFATTSYFESEVRRLTGRELRLSEFHTSYWEFVEKARRFVRERGNSLVGRGSEPNAVIRIWKTYGVVPASAYTGLLPGRGFYDDRPVIAEIRDYLASMQQSGDWDEDRAISAVRAILDRHLGPPPTTVVVDGRTMTPPEYLRDVVGLDLDNYTTLLSFMQYPFYQWCEYEVPDNYWHSRDYFNVPLDDFVKVVRRATDEGRSLAIVIDGVEPGFYPGKDVAFVPTFDIPAAYIDDAARQLRFTNGTTQDDHVVHVVGACDRNGERWYLIKDSGTHSRNGRHDGYMFYREDYVKLKTLAVVVPRDFAEKTLGRAIK